MLCAATAQTTVGQAHLLGKGQAHAVVLSVCLCWMFVPLCSFRGPIFSMSVLKFSSSVLATSQPLWASWHILLPWARGSVWRAWALSLLSHTLFSVHTLQRADWDTRGHTPAPGTGQDPLVAADMHSELGWGEHISDTWASIQMFLKVARN